MLTDQQRKKRFAAFRAGQAQDVAARRRLNSRMMFWKACGHKTCLRARACVDDCNDCSRRLWPLVPEPMKIGIRALVKAREARLSDDETKAAIVRDVARWREMMARQTAPQAAARATAQPAPPSLPIVRAAPRAPGPRVSVL